MLTQLVPPINSPIPDNYAIIALAITNLAAIITLIIRLIFSERSRDRKLAEDRELHARNLELIRVETDRIAAQAKLAATVNREILEKKIDQNTQLSERAFTAANRINEKIKEIGLANVNNQEKILEKTATIEEKVEQILPLAKRNG